MTRSGRPTRRAGLRTVLAAVAAAPLIGTAGASAARQESLPRELLRPVPVPSLEVMTFNLRFASARRPHSWSVRRPVMRALLQRAAPHVIGTQEGRPKQLRDIAADLAPHYDWIGTSRGVGADEAVAVFYDRRRLAPAEYEHFWLSDTPGVRGSNTWGGGHPRMVTWVRFRDLLDSGRQFCVLNTHLDNASQYARERSAALIAARISRFDPSLPLLLTGDFNTLAHANPVYDRLLAAGLVDTWDTARTRGDAYATYHGYKPLTPNGGRIDWILATPGVRVQREWTDTFSVDGQYPSDHLPVQASLTLG
ncbi:endonuclease/exonuclease/phosphatase family metal-dependent hydrolase [Streptomyces achromogenes]|uniref:endonuclease/exonuclease/phosphatase family protein n=1 Tax=Streptomyces achromogenes TaxID=67255 RepID=UPI0027866127|nr:endonuclease/exonuclease/phosphatase family protein [Streptomyces achromogenes]MDQ0829279.1 endonuclease/exonuclease/phosphatase family metal-dependent hydrolase [Streptomyces achromogenes]